MSFRVSTRIATGAPHLSHCTYNHNAFGSERSVASGSGGFPPLNNFLRKLIETPSPVGTVVCRPSSAVLLSRQLRNDKPRQTDIVETEHHDIKQCKNIP